MATPPPRSHTIAAILDMLAACWTILHELIFTYIKAAQDRAHGRGDVITVTEVQKREE